MPAPNTIEAFLELGFRSGLLDKTAVDACCAQLAIYGGPPQKPDQLAKALVRAGMLTSFQAEKLLSGRWRGFFLRVGAARRRKFAERPGQAGGDGQESQNLKSALHFVPFDLSFHDPAAP